MSIVFGTPGFIAPPSVIATDSETKLIQAGLLAPPLVCVSTAQRSPTGAIITDLRDRAGGLSLYRRVLSDPTATLVIHNGPFDFGVACAEDVELIPLVFDAFAAGRICCTVTLQKLIDIALGMRKFRRYRGRVVKSTYYLSDLIEMYYDETVAKEDTWRLSYGFLIGIPVEKWPPNARKYAITDGILHLRLWEAQQRLIAANFGGYLPDQIAQQRAAWALHLMSMWGIRAEGAAVDRFIEHCTIEINKMKVELAGTGILKPAYICRGKCAAVASKNRPTEEILRAYGSEQPFLQCPQCGRIGTCKENPDSGSRTMLEIQRRIVEALSRLKIAIPMTPPSPSFPGGQVKTDEETLRLTDDVKLHALADSLTFQKHLGQWGPVLRAAVLRPVCCRYNVLVDNGRTSCSGGDGQEGTNIQNPPRKGDVRPCIVPRDGNLLCSTDADTIELRALAQNCLEMMKWSRMADVIRRQYHDGGPDLHVVLAAGVARVSEAEALRLHLADDVAFANIRQLSKHVNFALAGGAGAETFVYMARGFGIRLGDTFEKEIARAKELKAIWLATWPEMREYFRIVDRLVGEVGRGTIRQLMSGRIRGGCNYTAAANSFFSGRVADAMKEILWHLADESYTGRCTSKHVHGGSNHCTVFGRSILHGSRPVMFLHDEPILEHPEDGSETDRAERQRIIVVDDLNKWMKDVPCTSSAVLMRRWQKGAKPMKIGDKLVPVRPEKVIGADGREKVKWVHDIRGGEQPMKLIIGSDQFELFPHQVDLAA